MSLIDVEAQDALERRLAHFDTTGTRRNMRTHTYRRVPDSGKLAVSFESVVEKAMKDKQLFVRRVRKRRAAPKEKKEKKKRTVYVNDEAEVEIRRCFRLLEREAHGEVRPESLSHFLMTRGEYYSPKEMAQMFKKDLGQDTIDLDELKLLCVRHPHISDLIAPNITVVRVAPPRATLLERLHFFFCCPPDDDDNNPDQGGGGKA